MKSKFKPFCIVAALFMALTTAPLISADQPVLLKVQSSIPSSLPVLGEGINRFAETTEKVSGGNVKIKLYEPGALASPLEILSVVSAGKIDAGVAVGGFWAGKLPAASLFTSVPFGPGYGEVLAWTYEGNGLKLNQGMYDEAGYNVKVIPLYISPSETSGWFKKEINSPEDLKGLRMRFFGLGAKTMEKLGVSTSILPGGEIYPALEKGVIDATEFAFPAVDRNLGFYRIAKFNYFPGWHQPYAIGELYINKDKWNSLSEQQQAIIEVAAKDTIIYTIARGEVLESDAIEMNEKDGVKNIYWSEEMLATFKKAWEEVAAEESAADPYFKKVWDDLSQFREKYKKWGSLGSLPRENYNDQEK